MPSQSKPGPPRKRPSTRRRTTPRGRLPPSTTITAPDFLDAINAFHYATAQGTPLNLPITINAQGAHFIPTGRATASTTRAFITAIKGVIGHVADRYNLTAAYTITLENPPGGGPGLHANVLMHGPTNDADHALFRQSLASAFQRKFRWDTKRPNAFYSPLKIEPARVEAINAHRKLTYHLKGCDDVTAQTALKTPKPSPGLDPILRDYFHPNHLREPQGMIHGPRVIIAPSIGKDARQEAGYTDTATLADPVQPLRAWKTKLRALFAAPARTPAAAQPTVSVSEDAFANSIANSGITGPLEIPCGTTPSADSPMRRHPRLEHAAHDCQTISASRGSSAERATE